MLSFAKFSAKLSMLVILVPQTATVDVTPLAQDFTPICHVLAESPRF
jgi:hypothetical protein